MVCSVEEFCPKRAAQAATKIADQEEPVQTVEADQVLPEYHT